MDNNSSENCIFNTIGVAGLGLIGGSMAKTIKDRCTSRLYGDDAREEVMEYLCETDFLDGRLTKDTVKECDLLIVALYPETTVEYVKNILPFMKKGTVVVDCCGIKGIINSNLSSDCAECGIHFIGGHPMAGIEKSGYDYSFAGLFDNASMILTKDSFTDEEAYEKLSRFFISLGFGNIKGTTPEEHDRVIAYTSQLAHVVSSAYIKGSSCEKRYGFSAGSFKDMTRVAYLNEDMWTSLFMENRDSLISEIKELEGNLSDIREALEEKDSEKLHELLKKGRESKEKDDRREQKWKEKFK